MTCIYLFDIFSCILIAVNVKRKVFTLYLLKYVWFSAVSFRARCLLSQIHLNIINKKKSQYVLEVITLLYLRSPFKHISC